MELLSTTRIALRALAKNKMRAGLTVLGIVIGVAAVTALVSIGLSASSAVQGQLASLGTNLIIVDSASNKGGHVQGGRGGAPTLTVADAEAIKRECHTLQAVSPAVGAQEQVVYGNTNWPPMEFLGVDCDYFKVRSWNVRLGRVFLDHDISSRAKVCVIGQTIVEKLFQTTNPLGKTVRVKNIPFEVVGVLEEKGTNIIGGDQDDIVLAPYTTVRSRLIGSNVDKVNAIFCSVSSAGKMAEAAEDIRGLLLERHKIHTGDTADFLVQNIAEIQKTVGSIAGMLTALLSAIAGIALLVGGVGIMNIMLVSVTERTREIGIRMAVGAWPRDILMQFLTEAVVLSTLGGLVGLALGVGASLGMITLINRIVGSQNPWPMTFSPLASLVAIGFAVATGVFFGWYPARRASRMDPIEALRYE